MVENGNYIGSKFVKVEPYGILARGYDLPILLVTMDGFLNPQDRSSYSYTKEKSTEGLSVLLPQPTPDLTKYDFGVAFLYGYSTEKQGVVGLDFLAYRMRDTGNAMIDAWSTIKDVATGEITNIRREDGIFCQAESIVLGRISEALLGTNIRIGKPVFSKPESKAFVEVASWDAIIPPLLRGPESTIKERPKTAVRV